MPIPQKLTKIQAAWLLREIYLRKSNYLEKHPLIEHKHEALAYSLATHAAAQLIQNSTEEGALGEPGLR